jgi:hypothetical protein
VDRPFLHVDSRAIDEDIDSNQLAIGPLEKRGDALAIGDIHLVSLDGGRADKLPYNFGKLIAPTPGNGDRAALAR